MDTHPDPDSLFFSGFQDDKNTGTFGLNILYSNQPSKVKVT
jgi:hypothetical protein